jgi:small subunit ribosomal protein S14
MTTSDWTKLAKQVEGKPAKKNRLIKHNKPKDRKTGITVKKCEKCGRFGAHISSYGLELCRHCFREIAEKIGFKKYS